MKRIRKKSKNLKYLSNIQNLEVFRQKLEATEFQENQEFYYKMIQLGPEQTIQKFSQIIPKDTERIDLDSIQAKIKAHNLEGYLISSQILKDILHKHPLPLSAQKQNIVEHICRMNNGPHNQAEGIHLIYAQNHELDPIFDTNIQSLLAPNLSSQLISTLHRHKKSQLTLGEAHSSNFQKEASGEAVLQISHLTYHALDIDLSLEVQKEFLGSRQHLIHSPSVFESCISIPYKIREKEFSTHGYILHLKGNKITPEKIIDIIGLEKTGFGGSIIASGLISSSVLSQKNYKSPNLNKKGKEYQHSLKKGHELIGTFTYEPHLHLTKNGFCNLEQLGHLQSLQGEITLVFFPYFQTFIGEYKR